MDRIERIEHPQEALLKAFGGNQAEMWTTLPGIIQSFNPDEMTVTVQPTIQAELSNPQDGSKQWVNLPLLVDVPIVIQSSGGISITMPITKDDECLVSFSSRCIDAWWQSGGVQQQSEFRMHDLSDGFAFIGPRSLPRILANYSTTTMQIRNDDASLKIDINPTTKKVIIDSVEVTINAPTKINGDVTVVGKITTTGDVSNTGTLKNNGLDVGSTHKHSGVTTGSSNTGFPI